MLTPKCIPWLHETLLQRMHAMSLTSLPFTLAGTNMPAAPWHVAVLVSQSPHSKSMNSTVSPPWIWAPSWWASSPVPGRSS